MFSKRSGSKCKRRFRRRHSTRHRRRRHSRKGGGKAELETELAQLEANWARDSNGTQNVAVWAQYDLKRRTLLEQIANAARKEEQGIAAADAALARAEASNAELMANRARFEQERRAREIAGLAQQARDDAVMAAWARRLGPGAQRPS
jgi:hypothetical protein